MRTFNRNSLEPVECSNWIHWQFKKTQSNQAQQPDLLLRSLKKLGSDD